VQPLITVLGDEASIPLRCLTGGREIASGIDNKTFVSLDRLDLVSRPSALTSRPPQAKLRVNFRLLFLKSGKSKDSFHGGCWVLLFPSNVREELACAA
jgi:hypothetical protein